MEIQVTGRRVTVTKGFRETVHEKTERLSRFLDGITRVEVLLDAEKKKSEFTTEMIVHAPRGTVLVCHATEDSVRGSLDAVVERMERQVKRFKGRKKAKKTRQRSRSEAL
ncbi:MAG: ribosome hibernation-promoting factor, HPF/YfiA family [Planctomycetota bacterium]|jgi:ribosomal subunit interface protein